MQPAFAPTRTDPGLALGAERLSRFDVAGPRYTSYPTADRFVETFGAPQYRQALARRAFDGQGGGGPAPLSLYVHIPFCESVCYYCACNKVVTKKHERALAYLDALECEFALQTRCSGRARTWCNCTSAAARRRF